MRKLIAAGMMSSLAALSLAVAGPAGAQSTPTGKAAAIVEPSVVYLEQTWTARVMSPATSEYTRGYLSDAPFTFKTRCTGFVINPDGYIATAGHCVDPGLEQGAAYTAIVNFGVAQFLEIRGLSLTEENVNWVFSTFDPFANWKVHGSTKTTGPELQVSVQHGVAAGGVETGEALSARVIDYKSLSGGDVALLKVESPNELPSLELADKDTVDVGTRVLSVGYPGAADEVTDATFEPTFQEGSINSIKTREGGQLPVWEISSEMTGGMSGGPTTDLQGRVVGVNSYGHVEESYNFISPVSLLNEMLAQNGVEAKLGPNDIAYRNGLNAFFAKDFDRAAFEFQRVTQLAPENQEAQEYLQKSLAQGGDPAKGDPANQGMPIAMIAGAIAGILLIGGGVAWMLMRRRRQPAAGPTPAMAPAPPAMAPATVAEPAMQGNGLGNGHAVVNGDVPEAPAPRARRKSPSATTRKSTATRSSTAKTAAPAKKTSAAKATSTRTAGKFCPECGTKNTASAKFCQSCGHAF